MAENRWENWSGSVTAEPSALYYPETAEIGRAHV